MGFLFRLIKLAALLISLSVVALVALVAYVLFKGGAEPPGCASAGAGADISASRAFDTKLSQFLDSGGRTTVTVTELEAAARASRFFEEQSGRIRDISICFEPGQAEGFLRIDTSLGDGLGVQARGTLDLSGEHPRLELTSARAAGITIPGILEGTVESAVNDALNEIVLKFPMKLNFGTDRVDLERAP
jgi:hypothetical protein